MPELTLKPLPEPDLYEGVTLDRNLKYKGTEDGYTASQVEQIRRDAVRDALGAAAEACEARYVSLSMVTAREGLLYNTAIEDACDAIRALMPKEEGK
jgi:hypothetical protein